MSAVRTSERTDDVGRNGQTDRNPVRRLTTETKSALKTTEMIAFVVAVFGVLIAAAIVDQSDAGGLGAKQAWLYVTILTVGYMISRGLAKSGSSQPYDEDNSYPEPSRAAGTRRRRRRTCSVRSRREGLMA